MKTCAKCGKEFEPYEVNWQKYCSVQCRQRVQSDQRRRFPVATTCEGCGEPLTRRGHNIRFCSERCRSRTWGKRYHVAKIVKACRFCATEFVGPDSQKYCSPACRRKWHDASKAKRIRAKSKQRKPTATIQPQATIQPGEKVRWQFNARLTLTGIVQSKTRARTIVLSGGAAYEVPATVQLERIA